MSQFHSPTQITGRDALASNPAPPFLSDHYPTQPEKTELHSWYSGPTYSPCTQRFPSPERPSCPVANLGDAQRLSRAHPCVGDRSVGKAWQSWSQSRCVSRLELRSAQE